MKTLTMHCKRCGGRIFDDTRTPSGKFVELNCVSCGRRWTVHRASPLGNLIRPLKFGEFSEK